MRNDVLWGRRRSGYRGISVASIFRVAEWAWGIADCTSNLILTSHLIPSAQVTPQQLWHWHVCGWTKNKCFRDILLSSSHAFFSWSERKLLMARPCWSPWHWTGSTYQRNVLANWAIYSSPLLVLERRILQDYHWNMLRSSLSQGVFNWYMNPS